MLTFSSWWLLSFCFYFLGSGGSSAAVDSTGKVKEWEEKRQQFPWNWQRCGESSTGAQYRVHLAPCHRRQLCFRRPAVNSVVHSKNSRNIWSIEFNQGYSVAGYPTSRASWNEYVWILPRRRYRRSHRETQSGSPDDGSRHNCRNCRFISHSVLRCYNSTY